MCVFLVYIDMYVESFKIQVKSEVAPLHIMKLPCAYHEVAMCTSWGIAVVLFTFSLFIFLH
jgi:hypothetical protein